MIPWCFDCFRANSFLGDLFLRSFNSYGSCECVPWMFSITLKEHGSHDACDQMMLDSHCTKHCQFYGNNTANVWWLHSGEASNLIHWEFYVRTKNCRQHWKQHTIRPGQHAMQLVTPLLHIASSSIVDCCLRKPIGIATLVDEIVIKFYMTVLHKKMCTPGCHRLFGILARMQRLYNLNK